ncbi:MAG: FtsW/RodA/SpoVE family cell cycle protein [Oscillospiraceae bacterium]|nr:FtsW/RodA/SpoVE family cell cycle protein [Oscillospiraceae bacterium]
MVKKAFKALFRYIKYTDKIILFLCICCSVLSVVLIKGMLNSDMPYVYPRYVQVQIVAGSLGILSAIIISFLDYHLLAKLWRLYVPIVLVLVLLTFFIGTQRGEADDKAWLPLPFGMSLQPSEFMKMAFILTFSLHLTKVKDKINSILHIILLCIHGAIPIGLVMLQGDDGTMLIFCLIFLSMLFAAGIDWKYIVTAVVAVCVAVPFAWEYLLSNDQRIRFTIIFNLESDPLGKGFQQLEGLTALGAGKIMGNGIFSGDHWWTPEIHNDFIFVFIGQAMGLVGCAAVIIVLMAIMMRFLVAAHKAADDLGRFICIGVFAMFAFQTIFNIGMCLSVLPVIGLTLPLISAGGTSVVTSYLGIGLALSVIYHSRKPEFER